MEIVGCRKGHYYNPELYSECPECARINEQSHRAMLGNDGLGVDTIDVSSIFRIQKQYVYCPKCQAMVDKSFSQCPSCGEMTQDPMQCDENLLSTLLWRGELAKYETYIWKPEKAEGDLEQLIVEYHDRVLSVTNGKLSFEKKSRSCICMSADRLTIDVSAKDLVRIQKQLDTIPFARWVTPISRLNHKYRTGDDSTDFYYKCKNRDGFSYGLSCGDAPGYLDLCKLLWDIVTSSPSYFHALDNDPAYDGKIQRTTNEKLLSIIKNNIIIRKFRKG